MPSTVTTNMGLVVPTVGQEPGPDWANDINSDLGVLDQHDHSSGRGVTITPSGMNISSDLPFNNNNATTLKTIRFQARASSLSGVAPNLGCVYVGGNELYYNDIAGNVVQITNNGSVNAGAGSITGLPSGTASASYSAGTFVWQSATNTPANMDAGSYILRNISAGSKGLTLNPPNAMAANYSLTLPSVPGSTSVLGIDASGNLGVVSSLVASGGADYIALSTTSAGANYIANTRTRTVANPASSGGLALSTSSGAFTLTLVLPPGPVPNLSVTITTTGRPVFVGLIDDANGTNTSNIGVVASSGTNAVGVFYILNGSTIITNAKLQTNASAGGGTLNIATPVSVLSTIDTSVNGSPGTYTYSVNVQLIAGSLLGVGYAKLIAYEL